MIKMQEWELAQERRTEEETERKLEERLEAVVGDSEKEREKAARYAHAAVKIAHTENAALKWAVDREREELLRTLRQTEENAQRDRDATRDEVQQNASVSLSASHRLNNPAMRSSLLRTKRMSAIWKISRNATRPMLPTVMPAPGLSYSNWPRATRALRARRRVPRSSRQPWKNGPRMSSGGSQTPSKLPPRRL